MKRILSLFLALALCLSLCPPGLSAQAAYGGASLVYSQGPDGSVELSLSGVPTQPVLHGVQLELTLPGADLDPGLVTLAPADPSAFSPAFSTLVSKTGSTTTVALYLVSAYALNPQETVELGSLSYQGSGIAPLSARAALLNQDTLQNGGEPEVMDLPMAPAAGTAPWGQARQVSASVTGQGTVTVPACARENQTVALRVSPKAGWKLGSIQIDGADLAAVGEGLYSFAMPAEDVQVRVTFTETAGLPFTDVAEGSWYYSAVEYVYRHKLMGGTGGGKFSPGNDTSRAMVVTILYQMEGKPAIEGKWNFSDVTPGKWYSDAVEWASQNNIVAGYDDGTYRPNKSMARQELALILYRYARFKGWDASAAADLEPFGDSGAVANYAKRAMSWAVGRKLIGGTDGNLLPRNTTTRAQLAVILRGLLR